MKVRSRRKDVHDRLCHHCPLGKLAGPTSEKDATLAQKANL
jgi:hypothetical protein